jgi:hypothetical protein
MDLSNSTEAFTVIVSIFLLAITTILPVFILIAVSLRLKVLRGITMHNRIGSLFEGIKLKNR